jgi:uncharacterized membrane protein
MAVTWPTGTPAADTEIAVRKIGVHDLRVALRQGWADFREKRGDLLFLGLIYPAIGVVAAVAMQRPDWLPLLFPFAAVLSLMGPAVASGYYEIARRREAGEANDWRSAFDIFRNPAFETIIQLGGLLAVISLLWLGAAWLIHSATLGAPETTVGAFLSAVFGTRQGWTMILIGNVVGLAFAAVVLAISAFSFPMLVDRNVDLGTAIGTSVRAVTANAGTMALWGVTVVALLGLGALPAFIGLAVVLPVLGYATWHLYARTIVR